MSGIDKFAGVGLMGMGALLVLVGIFPTPDDVTVVSPIVQIGAGVGLIKAGTEQFKK